jgi:tripartite-type tricarboxylate transporter receptor subunit TctC
MKKLAAFIVALSALAAGAVSPAGAQANYPTRPVRIILPFAAGGVADITARVVADKLGEKLGQRFIVENQPGAGGINAARSALSATPDGYTLAMLTNGTAISVPLFKSLPFDPLKDFAPISTLGFFDFVIGTNAASEFATLGDFLKAARAQPGRLNVGTINVGSSQNLSAELFKASAAIDFAIVPYRATPEVIVGLLRSDVQAMIDTYAAMKSGLSEGKIRPIASTGAKRSEWLPDVPTVQEAGVADYEVISWNALFARAGTPADVTATLNRALGEVLASADVKHRLLELGIEARAGSPEELTARLKADIDKWSRVIERAGIARQ